MKDFISEIGVGLTIIAIIFGGVYWLGTAMTPAITTLHEECDKASAYVRAVEGCERSMGCTFTVQDMELYVETYDYGRKYCNASSPIEEPKTTTRD
jgi:hypothetical protein